MSTFKHTPGPWAAEGAGRQIHTSSGTFYLAYDQDKHGNREFTSPTELDRNVHLVAAAPELLAALERIVSEARDWGGPYEGALIQAADAIAKARTGEKP